jgi:hypothetical protein
MSSYYSSEIRKFLAESDNSIMGQLASRHRHDLEAQQKGAWANQITILKNELKDIDGHIFFEFTIPRMGKRADSIIICGPTVFVVEFKNGAEYFHSGDIDQAHGYAMDLKDFHKGSHYARIIPVLIATEATSHGQAVEFAKDMVAAPARLGASGLGTFINQNAYSKNTDPIDPIKWAESGYTPTPTIIEAARALYENQNVAEITRSGAVNLDLTTKSISAIIENCKLNRKKAICFVTGVPGAGKTLAGLNIATQRQNCHKDENAVFLSGNDPLVQVLHEALARDHSERNNETKTAAKRTVHAFIQNIRHFRDDNHDKTNPPPEHVVVFDEAQRAWDQKQVEKFMEKRRGIKSFGKSESKFLIEVMDRHQDWCVVVCLIGGGQEINTGEAGVSEWLRAVKKHFPKWEVHASPQIKQEHYVGKDDDLTEFISSDKVLKDTSLHLSTSLRTFRANMLSEFVGKLLGNDPTEASKLLMECQDYPLFMTRDLALAKKWLKNECRGTRRSGLIASSGGLRLQPSGVYVKCAPDPEVWFLNGKEDVRSSNHLELVATEFMVQGLEVDWACVCWDADLRHVDGKWDYLNFKGTKWMKVRSHIQQSYLLNAYRVLLTRAREGLVIFVPRGNDNDHTILREFYDGTWNYLSKCGIKELEA